MIKQQTAARPISLPKWQNSNPQHQDINGQKKYSDKQGPSGISREEMSDSPHSPVWKYQQPFPPESYANQGTLEYKQCDNMRNTRQPDPQSQLTQQQTTRSHQTHHCDDIHDEFLAQQEYLAAQEQWDAVETVIPGSSSKSQATTVISFNEALQYFQTANLEEYKAQIKTSVDRGKLAAFWHAVFGPPRLHRDLEEERDLCFTIAKYPFSNGEQVHIRVLQTIYKKLTGSKFDCSRYGDHWQEIGFQGNDPSTDLRSIGFLGLMNLLHLVMDQKTLPIARDIYKLSQHPTQNFPFCVMSINITRMCIQALREGLINRECNKRKQVVAVINDFYVASFLYLYQIWKHGKKTIIDSGYVLREVEMFGKKNPRDLLKKLETYGSKEEANKSPRGEKGLDFSGIDQLKEAPSNDHSNSNVNSKGSIYTFV